MAVTTAAASFSWNDMGVHRITGPYNASQAFSTYLSASKSIDILADIMVNETVFHKLRPADQLLQSNTPALTFCMAESGSQYLVYSDSGQQFELDTRSGSYNGQYDVTWFDAVEGTRVAGDAVSDGVVKLTPPSTTSHWIA